MLLFLVTKGFFVYLFMEKAFSYKLINEQCLLATFSELEYECRLVVLILRRLRHVHKLTVGGVMIDRLTKKKLKKNLGAGKILFNLSCNRQPGCGVQRMYLNLSEHLNPVYLYCKWWIEIKYLKCVLGLTQSVRRSSASGSSVASLRFSKLIRSLGRWFQANSTTNWNVVTSRSY